MAIAQKQDPRTKESLGTGRRKTSVARVRLKDGSGQIVINDRLPGFGDYDTPEQFVPAQAPARPWEVCMTINESWGYNPSDTAYKSSRELVHMLCETVSRRGRFLLNVGPMGDGRLPPDRLVGPERLEQRATRSFRRDPPQGERRRATYRLAV